RAGGQLWPRPPASAHPAPGGPGRASVDRNVPAPAAAHREIAETGHGAHITASAESGKARAPAEPSVRPAAAAMAAGRPAPAGRARAAVCKTGPPAGIAWPWHAEAIARRASGREDRHLTCII